MKFSIFKEHFVQFSIFKENFMKFCKIFYFYLLYLVSQPCFLLYYTPIIKCSRFFYYYKLPLTVLLCSCCCFFFTTHFFIIYSPLMSNCIVYRDKHTHQHSYSMHFYDYIDYTHVFVGMYICIF